MTKRLSKQQRRLLAFLTDSPTGSWTCGAVRWELYGYHNLTGSQRASFSRLLRSLEERGLVALGGGQSDRQRVTLTPSGARRAVTIVDVCEVQR